MKAKYQALLGGIVGAGIGICCAFVSGHDELLHILPVFALYGVGYAFSWDVVKRWLCKAAGASGELAFWGLIVQLLAGRGLLPCLFICFLLFAGAIGFAYLPGLFIACKRIYAESKQAQHEHAVKKRSGMPQKEPEETNPPDGATRNRACAPNAAWGTVSPVSVRDREEKAVSRNGRKWLLMLFLGGLLAFTAVGVLQSPDLLRDAGTLFAKGGKLTAEPRTIEETAPAAVPLKKKETVFPQRAEKDTKGEALSLGITPLPKESTSTPEADRAEIALNVSSGSAKSIGESKGAVAQSPSSATSKTGGPVVRENMPGNARPTASSASDSMKNQQEKNTVTVNTETHPLSAKQGTPATLVPSVPVGGQVAPEFGTTGAMKEEPPLPVPSMKKAFDKEAVLLGVSLLPEDSAPVSGEKSASSSLPANVKEPKGKTMPPTGEFKKDEGETHRAVEPFESRGKGKTSSAPNTADAGNSLDSEANRAERRLAPGQPEPPVRLEQAQPQAASDVQPNARTFSVDPAVSQEQALSRLLGVYRGYYTAADGKTGLTLTVKEKQGKPYCVFTFYPLRENPGVGSGQYEMDLRYDAGKGEYIMRGNRWLKSTQSRAFVHLSGKLEENIFSGIVFADVPTSGWSFHLEKKRP